MQEILEVILSLQAFILFCIIVLLPLCAILLLLAHKFKWNRKSSAFVGLFYHMPLQDIAYLACSVLTFLLLIWMVIKQEINIVTMIAYLILIVLTAILHPNPKKILIVCINAVLTLLALKFAAILLEYSQLIQLNKNLVIIFYFLGVFVILYNFYYFLRSLVDLSRVRLSK